MLSVMTSFSYVFVFPSLFFTFVVVVGDVFFFFCLSIFVSRDTKDNKQQQNKKKKKWNRNATSRQKLITYIPCHTIHSKEIVKRILAMRYAIKEKKRASVRLWAPHTQHSKWITQKVKNDLRIQIARGQIGIN